MDKNAQAAITTVVVVLLDSLSPDENFHLYRIDDHSVSLQLSVGHGSSKWTVERTLPMSDTHTGTPGLAGGLWDNALVARLVSDLFRHLRGRDLS